MKNFSQHGPAKELFSLFGKAIKNFIKIIKLYEGDYSWTITLITQGIASLVFSGVLPQKWDHKEEQQQKPIQQKVNGANIEIQLSNVQ